MIQKSVSNNSFILKLWQKKWLRVSSYLVLTIVAVFLIFNKPIAGWIVQSYQPMVNRTTVESNSKAGFQNDYGSVKKLTLAQIAKARMNAKNISIIGQISVPDAGINLPIAKGINNTNLAFAVGTFRKDMKMGQGNYALAGHNMSNLGPKILFSPLYYRAKVGQKVYLTNMNKVYVYRITAKQFVSKYRVDLVQNTRGKIITLITCDANGNNRLMVRGKYVKSMQYKNAPQKIQRAFNQKFNY